MRSTVTNPDMFFQSREANNPWYQRLPYMSRTTWTRSAN